MVLINLVPLSFTNAPESFNPACSFYASPDGISFLRLSNAGVLPGWFEVYNTTTNTIRLVNAQKPNFFYLLEPYQRKSFNWHGAREVRCYELIKDTSLNTTREVLVSCGAVLKIVICNDYGLDNRYKNLNLE